MITQPLPFEDALRFLLTKEQLPAEWDASTWQAQEPDFRARAFFSANVESARFLDRAQGLIFDYLAKVRDEVTTPDGEQTTALRVAGRADFVMLMREFMLEEGMATMEELPGVNQKDVTDIRSMSRLNLIFDTTVRQSYGFGQWKQGTDPEVMQDWPAARLIRDRGVREFRPRHQNNLGEVRLKTDPRWAEFHNARDIGGFGVPWGPFGYNSGATLEDVSREEAEDLGLPVDSMPEPPDLKVTEGLEASTRKMNPDIKRKLLGELRGGPKPRDPEAAARAAALDVRRKMLTEGLQEAEARGDVAAVIRYRKAFAALPGRGLSIVEDGDRIRLG